MKKQSREIIGIPYFVKINYKFEPSQSVHV